MDEGSDERSTNGPNLPRLPVDEAWEALPREEREWIEERLWEMQPRITSEIRRLELELEQLAKPPREGETLDFQDYKRRKLAAEQCLADLRIDERDILTATAGDLVSTLLRIMSPPLAPPPPTAPPALGMDPDAQPPPPVTKPASSVPHDLPPTPRPQRRRRPSPVTGPIMEALQIMMKDDDGIIKMSVKDLENKIRNKTGITPSPSALTRIRKLMLKNN